MMGTTHARTHTDIQPHNHPPTHERTAHEQTHNTPTRTYTPPRMPSQSRCTPFPLMQQQHTAQRPTTTNHQYHNRQATTATITTPRNHKPTTTTTTTTTPHYTARQNARTLWTHTIWTPTHRWRPLIGNKRQERWWRERERQRETGRQRTTEDDRGRHER